MTNYTTGHDAEKLAADYLRAQGYKIVELNWHTRFCEIDIVAQKDATVYFTEVKYRKTTAFGSGLEYITSKKLKQMRFAAEMWVSQNRWSGDYQLAAIELTGPASTVTDFLTDL
ncbi:MAG TPA: YraN family protein [Candidatus Saccharimonadales bacterium]|nr:YraN family protein [Candidatus Saccharimonadales bacterium]